MAEHERLFSAISAYVGKFPNVVLENDVPSGTMTVVFKSHVPSDGPLVSLKVYGTRNVEVTAQGNADFRNFRRVAHIYANALELLDVFHLIEVEQAAPNDTEAAKGGLRIARAMRAER